jgi:hypothetical protein
MGPFYRALADYEPLIYIALAIGCLYAFRQMFRSWREWRNSVYGLEREFALRRLGQATVLGLLVLALLFVEFYVATFVAPSLPASDILTTPTLDLLAAPAGTLSPDAATQAALSPITPVVQSGMSGCVPDQIMITNPVSGTDIRGIVDLTGTADVPNFGFYKYEVALAGTENWATVSAGDKPVRDGVLGQLNTTILANGDYFLQLVILDNVGKTLEPCIIAIRVANQ